MKFIYLFLVVGISQCNVALAQIDTIKIKKQESIDSTIAPKFTGNDLTQFFVDHLKYPEIAKEESIEGKVYVQFVVNEIGVIDSVKVLKGIGYGCDKEAERLVKLTKKMWLPGKKNGVAARTKMILPIKFYFR